MPKWLKFDGTVTYGLMFELLTKLVLVGVLVWNVAAYKTGVDTSLKSITENAAQHQAREEAMFVEIKASLTKNAEEQTSLRRDTDKLTMQVEYLADNNARQHFSGDKAPPKRVQ